MKNQHESEKAALLEKLESQMAELTKINDSKVSDLNAQIDQLSTELTEL